MIHLYLTHALEIGEKLRTHPIAIFAEVPLEHPAMPGIGPIGGKLDFLCCSTFGVPYDDPDLAEFALIRSPHFLVIEAQQNATLGRKTSHAQLIAQLITLQYHDR